MSALVLAAAPAAALAADGRERLPAKKGAAHHDRNCPVIGSAGWRAELRDVGERGVTSGTVVVSARAELPTPGYSFEWGEPLADRSARPGVRVELTPVAPSGPVAQVLSEERLSFAFSAPSPRVRQVTVICGDRTLALIPVAPPL